MTITEFLLARIAEDERAAHRADKTWRATMHGVPKGSAGHVDRWSPYQVKIECEAKRRIVELHGRPHECSTYDHTGDVDNCTWCLNAEDCSTMRLLASVYADHPDYREEWRA